MNDQNEITQLLLDLSDGNKEIVNSLMPKVYKQLHQVAMNQLKYERVGHTLNATDLVHEAYLKMVDQSRVK